MTTRLSCKFTGPSFFPVPKAYPLRVRLCGRFNFCSFPTVVFIFILYDVDIWTIDPTYRLNKRNFSTIQKYPSNTLLYSWFTGVVLIVFPEGVPFIDSESFAYISFGMTHCGRFSLDGFTPKRKALFSKYLLVFLYIQLEAIFISLIVTPNLFCA